MHPSRQYPKAWIFNVLTVALLGWFILLGWTMTVWFRFGFDIASHRLHQLATQQRAAIIQFNDASIAERWNAVFIKLPTNQVSEAIQNTLPNNPFTNNNELKPITDDALQMIKQIWQLIGMTGHVMLIKLTILVAAIPLFALATTVGFVDGLSQRAIRTASLGRESTYVFHKSNQIVKRGFFVLLALWLAIPMSITPALMLVPVSLLLSLMVSITASRFKKYL
jgi:integrating conjugative element membrane protein (TIGR03747 family)